MFESWCDSGKHSARSSSYNRDGENDMNSCLNGTFSFFYLFFYCMGNSLCHSFARLSTKKPSGAVQYPHFNLYVARKLGLPSDYNSIFNKKEVGFYCFLCVQDMLIHVYLVNFVYFWGTWWEDSCMNCKAECIHISLQTALWIKQNKILFSFFFKRIYK